MASVVAQSRGLISDASEDLVVLRKVGFTVWMVCEFDSLAGCTTSDREIDLFALAGLTRKHCFLDKTLGVGKVRQMNEITQLTLNSLKLQAKEAAVL